MSRTIKNLPYHVAYEKVYGNKVEDHHKGYYSTVEVEKLLNQEYNSNSEFDPQDVAQRFPDLEYRGKISGRRIASENIVDHNISLEDSTELGELEIQQLKKLLRNSTPYSAYHRDSFKDIPREDIDRNYQETPRFFTFRLNGENIINFIIYPVYLGSTCAIDKRRAGHEEFILYSFATKGDIVPAVETKYGTRPGWDEDPASSRVDNLVGKDKTCQFPYIKTSEGNQEKTWWRRVQTAPNKEQMLNRLTTKEGKHHWDEYSSYSHSSRRTAERNDLSETAKEQQALLSRKDDEEENE